jgi:16S rRNA A1518/A1519 N6-dimethyltransferase RsmA/KsgA/DIM1 with predicted DNA glycosylase/AP lyase activity
VLLRLDRRGAPIEASHAELVRAGFAHRRKTLAASLQLAAGVDAERTRTVLARLGRPVNVRAEALSPAELLAVAKALA